MDIEDDHQAQEIARDWGVSVDLLEETDWVLESVTGNDDALYGYIVRFDEETDPKILRDLGVPEGQFYRDVSINAFDRPKPDWEDFALVEPAERPDDGRRAYYIDDERFTPSQFRRLSRSRKIEAMVQWFHENYEDPAVRTPYESAEGGYQWIWGGPYDAREEIGDQFSDVADEAVIEAAVDEVTSDGLFDWSPVERREDYEQDEEPDDGIYSVDGPLPDISELDASNDEVLSRSVEARRRRMLARLDHLEELVRPRVQQHGGIGHNNPPEPIDELPAEVNLDELLEAVAEARSEGNSPAPDLQKSAEAAGKFRGWATAIGRWLADRASAQIDDAISDVRKAAILGAVFYARELYSALTAAATAVGDWVSALNFPF